ncbi:hypothetical protein [Dyella telluris]|uniref:Uncharacterized protein n=1 Tax=Dyella telluris TaxID=2763498 RepID=A0A7G8Q4B2_9GAMM|nr:hypothetical protein [Dyella telluris]QNK01620.1 hypothetical protein H8F01_00095 [Dyella telluris]
MNADAGWLIEVERESLVLWCLRAMRLHRALRLALQRSPQIVVGRHLPSGRCVRRSRIGRHCPGDTFRPLAS